MKYPKPTTEAPDLDQLEEWMDEGICEATDGCHPIEIDGMCQHEYPSWFIELGLV